MSLFVLRASSSVQRTGAVDYKSIGDDPHFVYRFWLRRPRYVVVFLQALEGPLDPKIYVDRGNGFDEATAIVPNHSGSCIYCIRVSSPWRVSRIRIDPCSSESPFRYWAKCAWHDSELDSSIAEAKMRGDSDVPVYDIVIDGKAERRRRRNQSKSVADHYMSVVQMARRTAPPVDASLVQDGPLISFVVPVYNTPPSYLDDLLVSFRNQPTGAAELILSDDGSTSGQTLSWLAEHQDASGIKIIINNENRGASLTTNSGIEVARGKWIALLDHDDALSPCTVQLMAQIIQEDPRCQFIYTDEVVTDEKLRPLQYFLKPAYDEVLLSGVNYINHLSCYRRDRLLAIGGLRAGYDGSQDYDLLLRYLRDLSQDEIKHLPYPAYLWRRSAAAFSARSMDRATRNARQALAERYSRCDQVAAIIDEALTKTLHRVRSDRLQATWPRVSVVIPSRDALPFISRVLADLTTRTDYPDLEIIVVDNGTIDREVLKVYARYKDGPVPFFCDIESAPFNFSRQVNRGIALATGELILLLNNDIEVVERDWLREMVSCFSYPNTGIVGARLLYPNRRIQHAGVIVGLGGLAAHWFDGERESYPGPMARLHVRQSFTAVTGACMLVSRACLETTGTFDEIEFAIAYNDVDFCLRAVARDFRVVWTPFATLIHHQSASRGSDEAPANRERFARDKEALRVRHKTQTIDDRAFSPWYTRNRSNPTLLLLNQVPKSR